MKQNLFMFVFVLLLALAGFFLYFQNNLISNNLNFKAPNNTITTSTQPNLSNKAIEVKVYFANSKLNPENNCSLVYPVKRTISINGDPFLQTLNLLFIGPTEEEKNEGYSSVFSLDTKDILKNFDIDEKGTAYIDFYDIKNIIPKVSSSCGSQEFLSSIENTLKQFGVINKVIYAINGEPKNFYEWIQIGCSEENNNCDNTPFLKFYQLP